jgi:hypothetical protein
METCTLWQAIAQMRIEPAGAKRTFGSRLAEENGWSRAFAAKVDAEYRRFLYLAATAGRDVTPSDAVDQAWHLHLGYSRHYWDVLCGQVLGRPLHHGPSAGGGAEARRYRAQYADTLALYAETFGAPPPADIWPDPTTRFSGRWRRVDAEQVLVVPRRALRAGLGLGLALPLVACADALAAGAALPLVALGVGAFLLIVGLSRRPARKREGGDGGDGGVGGSYAFDTGRDGDGDGAGDAGGCGGGCGGD